MASDEVIDAMEDILRKEGVFEEMKKTLFFAVDNVMKKQKPIVRNTKVQEFGATTEGKYSLLLIADLLENLNMKHSLEVFAVESGFTSTPDLRDGLNEKFNRKFSSSESPMIHQIVTGAAGNVISVNHSAGEDKHSSGFPPRSPPHEETKGVVTKKNRSPLALHGSLPSSNNSSSFDLESSYEADDKSTTSQDRRYFSPDKKKKSLSPLGPSPPKKSPLASLPDAKGVSGGLPPLGGTLEPLPSTKRSPLNKISPNKAQSSDELSHDSVASSKFSQRLHDNLEDSYELEEKLDDSKDGFEISSSFEHSDVNLKVDPPVSKQSSHMLAPLGDTLSPYSTKSEKEEKSYSMDDSQPEELASASFLEESVVEESLVSEASNMFDDEDCILLDSPKKSPSPVQNNIVQQKDKEISSDPATEEDNESNQVNVNVSTASTVRMMRSQVGWDNSDEKDRPEDDYQYSETGGADSKATSSEQVTPGRSSEKRHSIQSEEKDNAKVDEFDVTSDFESIEDMDDYADDLKYDEDALLDDEDKGGINTSHASYRSNQEEDEEENMRLNAMEEKKSAPTGSLFSSPPRSQKKSEGSPSPQSNKNKSLDDTADDEDDYGDDFDDDFEEDEEEAEELEESIAESLEEELEEEEDDQLSFGSKQDSDGDDSDKDKSCMSSPSSSPTGKLPSLFTKTKEPEESKRVKSFDDSDDSDPFQDKSASFDEGPETSLASKDDLEDFSVGEQSSDNEEFLKDEDDESASAMDLSVKDQKSVGRLGDSNENEFSMSENEISGSHNLNDFGVDYTTSAAPPSSRRGGW